MTETELDSLIRENVKRLKPYSSARDDFRGTATIYMDANESPYFNGYNRYPDPHQAELKKQLAALKRVSPDQLFLGNGSDEAIDLLFRAFCEPGRDMVVVPQPTYGMFTVSAEINGIEVKHASLTEAFDLDPDAALAACRDNVKIIFLCSPNNPSGNLLSREKIESLLRTVRCLVVIDEAYIDFARDPGFVPLLKEHRNLVILQTLSKAWGLASLRLGLCLADPQVIAALNKIKPPYNISGLAQQVISRQLLNEVEKNRHVDEILKERERLRISLTKSPVVINVFPSDANFLLVRVRDAKKVYQALAGRGVVVRDRSGAEHCENCIRITVGTPDENSRLLNMLTEI